MVLEGQAQKVFSKLKEEGKIKEISGEDAKRLDKALSFPEKLRVDFNRKSGNSGVYACLNESGFLDMYEKYKKENKQPFYKKL